MADRASLSHLSAWVSSCASAWESSNLPGPKVSFLIPAYNYENYIGRCVEGVLRQSDASWDLLIVNDCSTDGTWQLCEQYTRQDSRIRAVNLAKNLGQYQIINEYSKDLAGEYCCVLDADDYPARDYVAGMYRYAKANDFDIVMCLHRNIVGDKQVFNSNYGPEISAKGLHHSLFTRLLKLEYFIIDCGTLVKTDLRRQIYSCLPKVPLYASTDDMQALFLALRARNIAVLKKPLYYHNQASAGTWRNKSEEFRLKKISSALTSLQMIYHLVNSDVRLREFRPGSLPMAQNIQSIIFEALENLTVGERMALYQKLLTFFEQKDSPFVFSSLSILDLEAELLRRGVAVEQGTEPETADSWDAWTLYKARLRERLRTAKRFLPYGFVRYVQCRKFR
ncbi:glycosyltransferase family 2 protein [Candidatus Haliotispira prima]|uniref:Glycosyltransferase family 2 protein n=1 Tax=Candidatus Haliotispira prima TaxID=3034016 RepID=A0ABY8MGQ4_9SPIO|nr:glycosyltransferase family 2 protein [Candidatus Haliotispira prima]